MTTQDDKIKAANELDATLSAARSYAMSEFKAFRRDDNQAAFLVGVAWARQNPDAAVKGLVEALKEIVVESGREQKAGDHRWKLASRALTKYEATTGRENDF